jgi:hypothetical protein
MSVEERREKSVEESVEDLLFAHHIFSSFDAAKVVYAVLRDRGRNALAVNFGYVKFSAELPCKEVLCYVVLSFSFSHKRCL